MTTIAVDMKRQFMAADSRIVDDHGCHYEDAEKIFQIDFIDRIKTKPTKYNLVTNVPRKYVLLKDHPVYFGVAGGWTSAAIYMNWFVDMVNQDLPLDQENRTYLSFDEDSDFSILVLCPVVLASKKIQNAVEGAFYQLFEVDSQCMLCEVNTQYYAIGSGHQFAITAMELGISAKDAVKIASKYDVNTGGDIMKIKFDI